MELGLAVVKTKLRKLLRRWLVERFDVPEIPRALARLKTQGLRPRVIYDVGAYRGDFALTCLDIWPEANIVCFEPLPHRIPDLKKLARRWPSITVDPTLLGAAERDAVQLFTAETASSVLVETAAPQQKSVFCRQTTIDAVSARMGEFADLIKIDVQGYELEVLKGATAALPHAAAILAEINLLDIHCDVPLLADIVGWLSDHGFVTFEICGLARRPLDKAMWQADFVFVPTNSPLRADKRYR